MTKTRTSTMTITAELAPNKFTVYNARGQASQTSLSELRSKKKTSSDIDKKVGETPPDPNPQPQATMTTHPKRPITSKQLVNLAMAVAAASIAARLFSGRRAPKINNSSTVIDSPSMAIDSSPAAIASPPTVMDGPPSSRGGCATMHYL